MCVITYLVKKFPAFYGIQTNYHVYWSLACDMNPIQKCYLLL